MSKSMVSQNGRYNQAKGLANLLSSTPHQDLPPLKQPNHLSSGSSIEAHLEKQSVLPLRKTSQKQELLSIKMTSLVKYSLIIVYLTSCQKDRIASIAIRQKFPKKSKICKEGELASSMYIVKSGVLKKCVDGIECGKLVSGQFCEEYAMLKKNSLRRDTIIVEEDAEVIAIGVEDIEEVLGRSLPLIITRNKVRAALLEHK